MEFVAQYFAIEELQLPNGWPSVEPTLFNIRPEF